MGYDKTRVDFTPAEHEAAENADKVYELIHQAAGNGIGPEDALAIPAAIRPSMKVWGYLASGSKKEFASKLISLGVMLERDNEWLDGDTPE